MSSFSTPLPFLQTWTGAGGSVILHKIFWLLFNLLKSNERKTILTEIRLKLWAIWGGRIV